MGAYYKTKLVKDEEHLFLLLISPASTGYSKTVLNNDALCQLFNAGPPPSPLCHYVIISSTPSLPLSSPFTEQAHNKTHSVTLCVFTPSLLAPDETAMPPHLAPVCHICDAWGGVWPAF